MKSITREWVQKAEGDFVTAEREFSAATDPNYDAVCFQSQQRVEKYLKGRLQEATCILKRSTIFPPYSI
jgi:HEPN domain-containing protein